MKRARLHSTIERQPEPHRQLDRMTVEHRQSAWQTKCDGVDMSVWLITESVCARTEQLCLSRQLHVHFETNDKFPSVNELLGSGNNRRQVHRRRCSRRRVDRDSHWARSSSAATLNIGASPSAGAKICTPTGRPASPVPNGTLIAA